MEKHRRGNRLFKGGILAFLLLVVALCGWLFLQQGAFFPATVPPAAADDSSFTAKGEEALQLLFPDLGQADCALFLWQDRVMLIDAGDGTTGETLAASLANLGVRKIDILIGTHAHADHIGGIPRLLELFPVEEVVLSDVPAESDLYTNLMGALGDRGMTPTTPVAGESKTLSGLTLEFLGPLEVFDDLNNSSLVCRVTYEGARVLMTGDMERASEEALIHSGIFLGADLLKVAHHGSATSSVPAFLELVSPKGAVICCGRENSYGLPAKETLETLSQMNIPLYRTDESGTLCFSLSNGEVKQCEVPTGEVLYIGNKKTSKYHLPACSGLPAEQNRVEFWSREAAEFMKYAPCGSCKP